MSLDHQILDDQREDRFRNPYHYTASSAQRIGNYLLDRIGAYLLAFAFLLLAEQLDQLIGDNFFADAYISYILFIFPAYWIGFEYFLGKTPAKFITKTKVVSNDGGPPSIGQVIVRTLCRFIPFEQFSFLGPKTIGWHDSIASTLVVVDDFEQEFV